MFLGMYIPFFLLFLRSCLLTPAPQHSDSCATVFESYEGELDKSDILETAESFVLPRVTNNDVFDL